mmetsp:Transcript_26604/g.79366  ORF Transcript_26604/g.79366 Transcript_26604/m.79366 type:complete len:198 (+) Transcript_26604:81-674(+)
MPKAAAPPDTGPVKDNKWNKTLTDIINREDKLRWNMNDRQMEARKSLGMSGSEVKLPRAHSCIGPFPGCRRIAPLSPRKSSAQHYLEQKLLKSSASDPSNMTHHDILNHGVSHEGQGRKAYLKERYKIPLRDRFESPVTANQFCGFRAKDQPSQKDEFVASAFGHQPLMETQFFRSNGVPIRMDNLPPSQAKPNGGR